MAGEPSERRGASVSSVSGQQITGHSSMAVRWRGEVGVGVVVVALGLELVLELAGHDPGPFPRHANPMLRSDLDPQPTLLLSTTPSKAPWRRYSRCRASHAPVGNMYRLRTSPPPPPLLSSPVRRAASARRTLLRPALAP